ncbi:hypothetical protein KGF57_003267 [Candida theae]|uniref:Uncharacterized protein n=1 Tax=Candida theae TaxID=1198502 RepID=A0AAD5BDZ7_9ASCO|nr:uncharacterized protein KGF57_003267 [Candida theae]KAI5957573.1 hypothetical protein KGF57_003267 [Candida theae]
MPKNCKTLKQQPSKLDLIDDTTLTSLPFPPPPPLKRPSGTSATASSSNSSSSSIARVGGLRSTKMNTVGSNQSATNYNGSVETEYMGDLNFQNLGEQHEVEEDDEDFYEYSYEEEDPIVLVEDYLGLQESLPSYTTAAAAAPPPASSSHMTFFTNSCKSTTAKHHLLRQKSLADFKKRVLSSSSNDSTDTVILQPDERIDRKTEYQQTSSSRTSSTAQQQTPRHHQSNDLQAIFGDLPSFQLLKHCDLCDKPLYEISSIINSKCNMNLKEFVCGDCISNYEVFITEFIQEQQLDKNKRVEDDAVIQPASKKIKNTKFWHVLNHISSKYNIRREVV